MLTIIEIIVILGIGIFIGSKNLLPQKILKKNDLWTILGIFSLLFVMGLSMGMNKEIMAHMNTLGISALIYALLTIGCSLLFTFLLTTFLFRRVSK